MRRFLLCLTIVFTALGFYFSSHHILKQLAITEDIFMFVVGNANNESSQRLGGIATFLSAEIIIQQNNSSLSSLSSNPNHTLESTKENISRHVVHSIPKNLSSRFAMAQLEQFGCLKHSTVTVNASDVMNQSFAMLEMKMRDGCGPLRRTWTDNPPLSPVANAMVQQQSNCSLPTFRYEMDDVSGMGAYLTFWSRSMCYAMEHQGRLRTHNPRWLWMDQTHCDVEMAQRSPWRCYFPKSEYLCDPNEVIETVIPDAMPCRFTSNRKSVATFRGASIEYMFRSLSPLVIQEAQRQSGVVFGPNGAPEDLITVHLRWGDKHIEMKLVPIERYIDAIWKFLEKDMGRSRDNSTVANIFLATEDPLALDAFVQAAPKSWNIYRDVVMDELGLFRPATRFNCASTMAKNTLGRAGLVNMGSLLLSMEANYFVLTTGSGFSRIMNSIRTSIIDPRCDSCTRMIDLKYGNWN